MVKCMLFDNKKKIARAHKMMTTYLRIIWRIHLFSIFDLLLLVHKICHSIQLCNKIFVYFYRTNNQKVMWAMCRYPHKRQNVVSFQQFIYLRQNMKTIIDLNANMIAMWLSLRYHKHRYLTTFTRFKKAKNNWEKITYKTHLQFRKSRAIPWWFHFINFFWVFSSFGIVVVFVLWLIKI